jgi:hypothetical protein
VAAPSAGGPTRLADLGASTPESLRLESRLRRISLRCLPMTVPGKGGRPRKWRSNADRIRAYRARQQGVPEPPILEQALQDGDELARALELARRRARRVT